MTAVKPIFVSMMRSRAGPVLVAFQIAVALAVIVNAVFMAEQRIAKMHRPTGIDDRNLFALGSAGVTTGFNPIASLHADLGYIRSVPGVVAATPINSVPLSQNGSITFLSTRPDNRGIGIRIAYYEVGDQGLTTLGVPLLAGRDFRADEVLPPPTRPGDVHPPEVLITESIARALFPGGNALGRSVYFDTHPAKVLGIVGNIAGPGWSVVGFDHVVLVPVLPIDHGTEYVVRGAPRRRDALMRTIEDHLSGSNPDRVIQNVRSLEFYKNLLYMADRNMAIFLLTVTTLLVAISCVGVFGLVTFNVTRRTKQIGTRRAVGARRADIIRYFLVENALITTAGVVIGCLLALGGGYWLSTRLELPRLDLYYLVGGVLVLWSISQLAAWHPARRAAAVPPSVATRTV